MWPIDDSFLISITPSYAQHLQCGSPSLLLSFTGQPIHVETRVCVSSRREQARSFQTIPITSPQTQKRKAIDIPGCLPQHKKQSRESEVADAALPSTPLTNASTLSPIMDSDDEFMSGASSQEEDFEGTEDSDDGSLGNGL